MTKTYFNQYGKELIAEANRTASIFDGSADIEVYYHGNESEKKNITPYVYMNDKFITEEEYNQQV